MDEVPTATGHRSDAGLVAGVLIGVSFPALVLLAYAAVARLQPPFDALPVGHPLVVAYVIIGALALALHVRGELRATARALARTAPQSPDAAQSLLRARVQRLWWLLVAGVSGWVVAGLVLLVSLGPPLALDPVVLEALAALALFLAAQVLVPVALVAFDAYGRAFGAVLVDRPALPSALRHAPLLLMCVLIALTLPLADYARFGSILDGTLLLVAGLMIYALGVVALGMIQARNALAPMQAFVDSATGDRSPDAGTLVPRALDGFGVAVAQTHRLMRSLETTRDDLRRSEARLGAFAEASSDWYFEWDAELRQIWISDRFEVVTGLPSHPFIGRQVLEELRSVLDDDVFRSARSSLLAREPIRDLVLPPVQADASGLWLRISALPIFDGDGAFAGYLGTGTNITAEVRQRFEISERDSWLAQAQKMEAVGQLTGGIAHDFNNLLTAVGGNLELALERARGSDEATLLEESLASVRRGSELIHRLLAFSRQQELRPEVVDVGARIEGAVTLLRRALGERITLDVDVRDPGAHTLVDPAQLDSALLNLVINARDAMPGGGRLTLGVERVDIAEGVEPHPGVYVRLSMTDTGDGIPSEVLPHVFEPFFTTKGPGEGSGLGLSMIYGFAQQSGGTLHIDSEVGRGTRVALLLPWVTGPQQANPAEDTERVGIHRPGARQARVLLVEDERAVRRVVTAVLERLGCEVHAAGDGEAAVAALELAGDGLDLVLSDVVLPGTLSGVDVLRRCREVRPEVACVLMSGYPRDHLATDEGWVRDVPLLGKPFRLEELETLVLEMLPASRVMRRGGS